MAKDLWNENVDEDFVNQMPSYVHAQTLQYKCKHYCKLMLVLMKDNRNLCSLFSDKNSKTLREFAACKNTTRQSLPQFILVAQVASHVDSEKLLFPKCIQNKSEHVYL